ncbi:DUF5309 family protein [uncultured Methanobrevibacter sp.]|uniref:SU10 major capsid protein n=1 Tax=uncultured Methanobrevibacter sp. TaxID=253161 RepID=UPI00263005E9|nr:DUF5309 family protein [uncultured Methanobrevibacter sp.]
MNMKDLELKMQSQSNEIQELRKAMMITSDAAQSMQISYTPELQTKVFEKAPYFRFLESKGRVLTSDSTYVGFYKKTSNSASQFIAEDDDIPAAIASKYDETVEKMKTIIHPIDISLMAQMGNKHIDLLANEVEDGYIKVTNITDDTLLQGTGSASTKDFTGFTNAVKTNKEDLNKEAITEDIIDDMLTDIIDGNGGTPDCIVTTNAVAKVLKKIVAPYRRYNDKIDIGLGHRVVAYEAPNGLEVPILIDSNLKTNDMLFVDSSTIEVQRLMPPTLFTDLPTTKLGTKEAIVTFLTSQNLAEYKNGLITGIDVTKIPSN